MFQKKKCWPSLKTLAPTFIKAAQQSGIEDCSRPVSTWLLSLLRNFLLELTPRGILELSFDAGCDSLIWITVQILEYICRKRNVNKAANLYDCLSILHDNATLLRGTKHGNISNKIIPLITLWSLIGSILNSFTFPYKLLFNKDLK